MSRNILKTSILVLSLLAVKSALAEHDHSSWWCGDRITHMSDMVKSLHLSTAQAHQVNLIRTQFKAIISPEYARIQDLRIKIQQEVQSEKMNQLKLDHLINQKAQVIDRMMRARAIAQHQVYVILNQQQQIIYKKQMNMHHAHIAASYAQCTKEPLTMH